MTAPYKGVTRPPHPREVIDTVKRLFLRGDSYNEIANQTRRKHKLATLSKKSVAGIISRMRGRGELEAPTRKGGHRSKNCHSKFDQRPPVQITLPPLPPRRFS